VLITSFRLGWVIFFLFLAIPTSSFGQSPQIEVWYGDQQHFGQQGRAQRWVNILGNITAKEKVDTLHYRLNQGDLFPLTLGSDLHRLANEGDFNVEISWEDLKEGENVLQIHLETKEGQTVEKEINIHIHPSQKWPMPYRVDFSKVKHPQERVQVVDGLWEINDDGIRTTEPFYDRVISLGDTSWTNYEATARITIHGFTPSEKGPPTYDVTHFGMAFRWRGHTMDGRQPSRQWYPLGAQGEFLLHSDQSTAKWRILYDGGKEAPKPTFAEKSNNIELNKEMYIKGQVTTLEDGDTRYRFKQWMVGEPEPRDWDIEGLEKGENDYSSGALCLVPHNSDVTIHEVMVEPLRPLYGDWYAKPGPGNLHFSAPMGSVFGAGGDRFSYDFIGSGQKIAAVQVNSSHIVRGIRFRLSDGEEVLVGQEEGEWSNWFALSSESQLEGISGRSGWYIDAIQFHFANGLASPEWGGKGGDTTFDLKLNRNTGHYPARIRGFYGTLDEYGIETLGLIFDPAD
jgi:hypothetical protein